MLTKVNATDTKAPRTSGLISKTQHNSESLKLFKKFEDINNKITDTKWAGEKDCLKTAGITKCKSLLNKKKHYKTVFLAKSKLNSIEVLVSQALINSNISHDEFVWNNVWKECNDMKEQVKNSKT